MVVFGFGVIWWGYLEAIYGWSLLKGYDIRWRDLANPIHPYQWPPLGQSIPTVPKGQILPGGGTPSTTGQPSGQPPSGQRPPIV